MDIVEKQISAATFIGCLSTLQCPNVTSACTFHLTYYMHACTSICVHTYVFVCAYMYTICNSCTHSRENTFIFLSMDLSLKTLFCRGHSSWTQTDRSPEAFQMVKTLPRLLHPIPLRLSWYQVYCT